MTEQPPRLDLPAGPFAAHLQAAHSLVTVAAHFDRHGEVVSKDMVAVHAEHMRRVAVATATRPPTYPRPDYKMGDDRVPGWDLLLLAGDETREVLCGWHTDGSFHAWATTEAIADACRQVLLDHLNDMRGNR